MDPKTAELVRLIVRTEELPPETDSCEIDTTLEYSVVQLSGSEYLLPKVARQRFIGRDGFEGENTMSFSACRDFQAESKVEFDAAAEASGTLSTTPAAMPDLPAGLPVTVELTTAVRFGEAAAGDRIEGRLTKPIQDEHKRTLMAEGAVVQGRLMRVEIRHSPRPERIVVLRWETIRIGATRAAAYSAPQPHRSGSETRRARRIAAARHGDRAAAAQRKPLRRVSTSRNKCGAGERHPIRMGDRQALAYALLPHVFLGDGADRGGGIRSHRSSEAGEPRECWTARDEFRITPASKP